MCVQKTIWITTVSRLPIPYCKGPAHLATDSLFAVITDLSANLRRKDIMKSGLWPPLGLASGVICPAKRYWRTERGIAAAAVSAITCTNKSPFPAREPKSYQCSACMPSGPGSLSRGILRSVVGCAQPLLTRIGLTRRLAQELGVLGQPGGDS